MDTLSHRDWLRLQEVVLDINEAPSLAELPHRVLAGLQRLFSYEAGSVQDDRGGAGAIPWLHGERTVWQNGNDAPRVRGMRVMPAWGPPFLALREAFFAVSAEKHPHTEYYRRTGDGMAQRLSDLVPIARLRRTQFFNEISRPLGITAQLTVYIPLSPTGTLTVAACRNRLDFDDRERAVLDVLRPHVGAAWRRAMRRERLPSGNAATGAPLQKLGLTTREAEVLRWVAEGKTNPEVAVILEISTLTVKLHVEHILAKLGCETRTAAAFLAHEAMRG